jgi:hypothetical protein
MPFDFLCSSFTADWLVLRLFYVGCLMPKKGEDADADEDVTGELRAVTDLMGNDEVLKIYEVDVEALLGTRTLYV